MKLVHLITLLVEHAQRHPDADVKFFNAITDDYVNITHAEAGEVKGLSVVVVGEASMKNKVAMAKLLKGAPKSPKTTNDVYSDIFGNLFDGLGKKKP